MYFTIIVYFINLYNVNILNCLNYQNPLFTLRCITIIMQVAIESYMMNTPHKFTFSVTKKKSFRFLLEMTEFSFSGELFL